MVKFEDALKTVLSQAVSFEVERVAMSECLGRVLAEDLFSDMDMPPFDKSAVDGYACRLSDIRALSSGEQSTVTLRMVETIPAGTIPAVTVTEGQCSKIMTGSMVPAGADCVVMVENTVMAGGDLVQINQGTVSKNICYRGEDIKAGEPVLQKGIQIGPAQVAVLAATGAIRPLVAKLPRVAVISTGDELVEPGVIPGPAQIRNSNAWQLEAQVKSVPSLPVYCGIAPDEGAELRKIIDLALENNDVVLLTGGVSMGDFDFVPAILQEAGVDILFKSIAIQPGRPTVFGRRGKTFIFGLPGNPVSAFVLFEIMVKPLLHLLMGSSWKPLTLSLPMGVEFSRHRAARRSMIPVLVKDGAIFPIEYHGSAHINAYTLANAIMTMEIGATTVKKGEQADVRPL